MALPVREGAFPLTRMHDEIDRMFQEFTLPRIWPWTERGAWTPALDLYEKDGRVVVEAELPGIAREDVKVSYTDHALTIQGETKKETEEKREGYYRAERRYGSFHRVVPMPEDVDFGKAVAEFADGVLKISAPRASRPEEKVRNIPIKG